MTDKQKITVEILREYLDYDPLSGNLTWKKFYSSRQKRGQPVGHLNRDGYYVVGMFKRQILAQRVVWAIMTGEFPAAMISFRDKNRSNLKWENLFEMKMIEGKFDHATPEGRKVYHAAYRAQKPDKNKDMYLQATFGIDLKQYEQMFKAQNGCCANCKNPETAFLNGKPLALAVDHDHTTGAVRELLCRNCNVALGLLKDDPALMRSLAVYTENHKKLQATPDTNVIQLNKGVQKWA